MAATLVHVRPPTLTKCFFLAIPDLERPPLLKYSLADSLLQQHQVAASLSIFLFVGNFCLRLCPPGKGARCTNLEQHIGWASELLARKRRVSSCIYDE